MRKKHNHDMVLNIFQETLANKTSPLVLTNPIQKIETPPQGDDHILLLKIQNLISDEQQSRIDGFDQAKSS